MNDTFVQIDEDIVLLTVVDEADSTLSVQPEEPVSFIQIDEDITLLQIEDESDLLVLVEDSTGLPGPPGPAGGGIPTIYFSYGDAPGAIFVFASPGLLTLVRIVMTTTFNGAGATLQLGTPADPDAVMRTDQNNLTEPYEYQNTPDLRVNTGDSLQLTISPAGSTQGAGFIILSFNPD